MNFARSCQRFHQHMRFTVSQTSLNWSPNAWRNVWIKRIHIQADMDRFQPSQMSQRLPRNRRNPVLVDVRHRKNADATVSQSLPLFEIQVTNADHDNLRWLQLGTRI